MNNNTSKYRGAITIEVVTAIFLLFALTAALLTAVEFFGRCNHLQWTRQRCLAAAQAQMDSIMMQKTPLSQDHIERLWPGITCTIEKQSGHKQWKGLDLYIVTATANIQKREVSVQMKRYIKSGD